MNIFDILLVSLGLSADAFSVALCNGLKSRKFSFKNALLTALFFGGFQALMPIMGFYLGIQFEQYIVKFDHWIAFVILGFIGGKMVYEAVKKKSDDKNEFTEEGEKLKIGTLFIMAIATSIDALIVGVTMSFLKVNIFTAASLIGGVTFVLCLLGVFIGNKFGARFKSKAEAVGGVILILIGLKILLEHLGVISF